MGDSSIDFSPVKKVEQDSFVPVKKVDEFVPVKQVKVAPQKPFWQDMADGGWTREIMRQAEPVAEIAAYTLLNTLAYPVAKMYGVAGGLAGRDQKEAEQDIYKLIPQPKTEGGKLGANVISWPFEQITKPARLSGDWLREQGYPNLAYAVESGLEVVAFAATGKAGKHVIGKIQVKQPWEKGDFGGYKSLVEAEKKAEIERKLAMPKERPLAKLKRKEESIRADDNIAAAEQWQETQLANKRFDERIEHPNLRKAIIDPVLPKETKTTPLTLAEKGFQERMAKQPYKELWTTELGTQAPDFGAPIRKATELVGGKPGISERGVELHRGPQGEFGLKITDRSIPESKKRIAEAEVNAILKRGASAEDVAAVFENYLGPNHLVTARSYLINTLGDQTGSITIPGLRKTREQAVSIMDLVKNRRIRIDQAFLDSAKFIAGVRRQLTEPELEAAPFIRQGIKDTKVLKEIGRQDLIPVIENAKNNPKLTSIVDEIGKYYDKSHEFLREHWGDDLGFVENYVTQMWDIPKNKQREAVNYFATRNPFVNKRTIPTLEEGIKQGYKPKTLNIARLLSIYDQYKIKTAYNMRFAKDLLDAKDSTGTPVLMKPGDAPQNWVTVDHPAINRVIWSKGGKGSGGKSIGFKQPVKVHPDIAKEVEIVLGKPFSHETISAMQTVNAFLKKSMLSFSFFHHFALTESALGTGIGRKAVSLWNPKKMYDAVKNKNFEIFKQSELAKDAIRHEVSFGALEDVQVHKVNKALESLEHKTRNLPGINKATKTIRRANEIWDTALWDYYHNTLKLYAYEHNVQTALKGKSYTPEQIEAIKNEMGRFTNDTFGGQNWDLTPIMSDPKIRQMAHWILLAPDWTFSTLKQAMSPAKGLYKMSKGEITGKPLAKTGALFWARAAFYFTLVAESLNYRNTQKDYGKGRFTWNNAPGHGLNIYIGKNPDGTERYLRMGKQFREVLEWAIEPEKKLGGKLSPVFREAMRQLTKSDPGSGYPTEFQDMQFWESLKERGLSILEMPLPFSLREYVKSRPGSFMLTFPTSRGMTNYKATQLFKEALKEESVPKLRRVFFSALENNLSAEDLLKSAKSSVKADITFDNKKMAAEMWEELKELKDAGEFAAMRDLYGGYVKRGVMTPEIHQQINKLIEGEQSVSEQKIKYKVR